MGRKLRTKRVPQRRKIFKAKKGRKTTCRCPSGRRWCPVCSRRLGVERRYRKAVRMALHETKGRRTDCEDGCECMVCVGDSHCADCFTDRGIHTRW